MTAAPRIRRAGGVNDRLTIWVIYPNLLLDDGTYLARRYVVRPDGLEITQDCRRSATLPGMRRMMPANTRRKPAPNTDLHALEAWV